MKIALISLVVIIALILAYNHKEATKRVMEFLKAIADWIKSVKDSIFK